MNEINAWNELQKISSDILVYHPRALLSYNTIALLLYFGPNLDCIFMSVVYH